MSNFDLTPLLYPELFSETERAHAQAQLEQDPQAQVQLDSLLRVRAVLDEEAQRYSTALAQHFVLTEEQRILVMEEARKVAFEHTHQASSSWSAQIRNLFFSPHLAWLGVLSLALVSIWHFQNQEISDLAIQPIKIKLSTSQGEVQNKSSSKKLQPTQELDQELSMDLIAADTVDLVEQPDVQILSRNVNKKVIPIKPTAASTAEFKRNIRSDKGKKERKKSRKPKDPAQSMPSSKVKLKPIRARKSSPSKRTKSFSKTAVKRKASMAEVPLSTPPSNTQATPPSSPLPSLFIPSASSVKAKHDRTTREEVSSTEAMDSTDAIDSTSMKIDGSIMGSMDQSAPTAQDEPSPFQPESNENRVEQTSENRIPSAFTVPWQDALSAYQKGRKNQAIRLLESWLNTHMSHARALEAAQLGTRWSTELGDQQSRRRFIAYDRALQNASSPAGKSSARSKRRSSDDEIQMIEPKTDDSSDNNNLLGY